MYSLGESLTVLADFTSDREKLQAVLANYRPTSITPREKVDPKEIHTPSTAEFNAALDQERRVLASFTDTGRTVTTLRALAAIAAHVAAIPDRKNLVWLTASLPFPGAAAAKAVSRANIAIYPVDARGLLPRGSPMKSSDTGDFMARTLRIDTPGGMANYRPPGVDAMVEMADQTGGRAFINTNDLDGAIRRALDDSNVYVHPRLLPRCRFIRRRIP